MTYTEIAIYIIFHKDISEKIKTIRKLLLVIWYNCGNPIYV